MKHRDKTSRNSQKAGRVRFVVHKQPTRTSGATSERYAKSADMPRPSYDGLGNHPTTGAGLLSPQAKQAKRDWPPALISQVSAPAQITAEESARLQEVEDEGQEAAVVQLIHATERLAELNARRDQDKLNYKEQVQRELGEVFMALRSLEDPDQWRSYIMVFRDADSGVADPTGEDLRNAREQALVRSYPALYLDQDEYHKDINSKPRSRFRRALSELRAHRPQPDAKLVPELIEKCNGVAGLASLWAARRRLSRVRRIRVEDGRTGEAAAPAPAAPEPEARVASPKTVEVKLERATDGASVDDSSLAAATRSHSSKTTSNGIGAEEGELMASKQAELDRMLAALVVNAKERIEKGEIPRVIGVPPEIDQLIEATEIRWHFKLSLQNLRRGPDGQLRIKALEWGGHDFGERND